MSNSPMVRLLNNPVCFLGEAEHDGGVAISSRIRLARNLAEFPFPPAAAPEQLTAIRDLVADTVLRSRMLGAGAFRFDVADLPTLEQEILFEVVHGVNKQSSGQRLLDIAKKRGAPDNVTCVLIQI